MIWKLQDIRLEKAVRGTGLIELRWNKTDMRSFDKKIDIC